MTSSRKPRRAPDAPTNPLIRRLIVGAVCIAALGVAIFAFRNVMSGRSDPAHARAAIERAEAFLRASNATAARSQATDAVRMDPGWGIAHAVLAQSLAQLDEGVAAEAELRRAADAGFDMRRAHQLMAHAYLLQGDEEKALAEADKAAPEFHTYALRVKARAYTALGNLAAARDAAVAAVRSAPRDAPAWADLARFRFTVGDVVGSIAAANNALKLDPGNIDALILRGEQVRGQYGLVSALPWFEAALKRDPYHHDALVEYAATLGDLGRTNDMLASARRAMEARPGSPQALYLQAVLAARAEKFELARDLLDKSNGGLDGLPGALLLAGSLDLQEGDYQQAIARFQALLGDQPMNITVRRLLATALLRSDSAKNAIDLMRPVVARGDADSYAFAIVGRAFERIGRRDIAGFFLDRASVPVRAGSNAFSSDDSLPVLDAAAAQAPDDPRATVPVIRGLLDRGDIAGALAQAQKIAGENPGAPASQTLVGDVLMIANRPADAIPWFRRAADIRFDQPTMLRLVEAMDRAGNRTDASDTLGLFLSQNPGNAAALRLAAHWQIAAGEYDDAVDTLEALKFRVGTRDAALLTELAMAYSQDGNDDAALDNAELAYGLAPMNPATADTYGWALFNAGERGGAVQLLQKAVALAPRHATIRWHLAQVYDAIGRKPEARLHAGAALADPAFTDRAAAQALLARS